MDGKSISLKNHRCRVRVKIIKKLLRRFRLRRRLHHRHWIADVRPLRARHFISHFHAVGNRRVRLVHHPRIHVARRHCRQRRPHVFHRHYLGRHRIPQLQFREPRFGIDPRRHRLGVAQRDLFYTVSRQVRARLDLQSAVRRHHHHQRVAEPVPPRRRVNQALVRQPVHLRFVRGKENVCRRTFLDLPRQHARRLKVKHHLLPGFLRVIRAHLLQAVREARRRKHRQVRSLGRQRSYQEAHCCNHLKNLFHVKTFLFRRPFVAFAPSNPPACRASSEFEGIWRKLLPFLNF